MSAYRRLEQTFRRHSLLGEATGVLYWDMAVVMPPGGAAVRADQLANLQVLAHEILTNPRVGEDLDRAEADATGLDDWQAANLREMRRSWLHATAVPADLVEARCIDARRLSDLAGRPVVAETKGNRPGCRCARAWDVGAYDTCPHGCVYCYAVRRPELAKRRYRSHDPDSACLAPPGGSPAEGLKGS